MIFIQNLWIDVKNTASWYSRCIITHFLTFQMKSETLCCSKMTQFLGRPLQYDRQFGNFSRRMSEVDLDFSWNQPGRLKYRSWSIYQNLSGELGIAVADIKLNWQWTIKSTFLFRTNKVSSTSSVIKTKWSNIVHLAIWLFPFNFLRSYLQIWGQIVLKK